MNKILMERDDITEELEEEYICYLKAQKTCSIIMMCLGLLLVGESIFFLLTFSF